MGAKTLFMSNLMIYSGLILAMFSIIAVMFSEQAINMCIILQLEDYVQSEFVECMGDRMESQIKYTLIGIVGLFILPFGLMLNKFR